MVYTKRFDGRKLDEMRPLRAEIGIIPRANGSALFGFGKTIAIAAVYGPRQLYPQHLRSPEKALLRVKYDMMSFSVSERKRPGRSRRSTEISSVTARSLESVIPLEDFPNSVIDVFIDIIQANASTRVAGINAASMALASAGIPMNELVTAVSLGKVGGKLVVDVSKEEEDYGEKGVKMATDIPIAYLPSSDKITLLQLDGKVTRKELADVLVLGKKACSRIRDVQAKALKDYALL